MRIPLIAPLDANCSETRPLPALDGAGKILVSKEDGNSTTYQVDSVECRDFLTNGKSEINFWLKEAPAKSWDVIVTDRRIGVCNKLTQGLIGKAKAKVGKSSAGHLYYASISNLSVFLDSGTPVLLICCYRNDGTRTAFTIKSADIDSMRNLAVDLHGRIDQWIIAQGRKFDETTKDETYMAALKKWNEFDMNLWTGGKEYNVFTPCQSWDKVPDSRVY